MSVRRYGELTAMVCSTASSGSSVCSMPRTIRWAAGCCERCGERGREVRWEVRREVMGADGRDLSHLYGVVHERAMERDPLRVMVHLWQLGVGARQPRVRVDNRRRARPAAFALADDALPVELRIAVRVCHHPARAAIALKLCGEAQTRL